MFNSQKINTDPEPWTQKWLDGIMTRHKCMGQTHNRWRYQPRPEFDNKPNPILVEVRKCEQATGDQWGRNMMLDALTSDTRAPEIFREAVREACPEHLDHARKVLERLAVHA